MDTSSQGSAPTTTIYDPISTKKERNSKKSILKEIMKIIFLAFVLPFLVLTIPFAIFIYRNLVITNSDDRVVTLSTPTNSPTLIPTPTLTPTPILKRSVTNTVTFAPQAPFGDWSDPRQQDGCEEMSAILAVKWTRGETITKNEALSILLNTSEYIEEKYGYYQDSSAIDTNKWIIRDYFGFENSVYKEGIRLEDIKQELWKGNLVIIPTNGQVLGNPNFTALGPERHMLVIIGYDMQTKEFITNDVGTRQGASYRYNENVLFNAIRDYETGYHQGFKEIDKSMIVISKE